MRSVPTWTDHIPNDSSGNKVAITDICFRPDGIQLIAAVGQRVNVYDASLGDLLHSLRGHKDTVYCVSYSSDGKQFASGGADKQVIIWTNKGEGILHYSHNDTIQAVAFNPITHQLVSVTAADFGLWTGSHGSEKKSVAKHKLSAKGLCASWTADGQNLAIGMVNGVVSLRSRGGDEKQTIKRSAPVWSVCFNPNRDDGSDVLCVGSWDRRLSFYQLNGKQIGRDKELTFDPCCVSYFINGDYLLVSGSDKKAGLYTKDGTFLVALAEGQDWMWAVRQRPKQNAITLCTNDGVISSYQLVFATVHSIYQEQYVFREMMTDIVIQLLTVERKLRIPCKDYVRKVAVYRDRLAVQLSERIVVYELFYDDQYELKYRVKERINKKLECSLLCVTSANLVLCQDKRLTSYDFLGQKRREWVVDSVIRYIKVVGGLAERESLLVGLKNGTVLKIFVDNSFLMQLVKLNVAIRCLDLSASRTKLAIVDENANCLVYSLKTKELLFQEPNANAVAWNTDHEDILCFSGNGMLSIKTGMLPPYQQKLQGFVVGFKGNKVFCLHYSTMSTVDVPHSHALHRYVERKDFDNAYRIACLGVTEDDWKMLGMHAMTNLQLEVARKAFIRVREVKFVELLNRVELDRRISGGDDSFLLGDILAFQEKLHDAARCFIKAGLDARAIEMFCDMKMWDDARKVCQSDDHIKDLIRRQARWEEETGDAVEAAKLWLKSGDFNKAIKLMGDEGAVEPLMEVCRTLPKTDTTSIAQCGAFFREYGAHAYAVEAYERIGDSQSLLQLHVEMGHWSEAFELLERFPKYAGDVYVPYAAWLAMNDRFEEAQDAFRKARRPQEALKMMEQLAGNSVITKRFTDAAFYFYKLAQDVVSLASVADAEQEQEQAPAAVGGAAPVAAVSVAADEAPARIAKHDALLRKAELYFVYNLIQKYVTQPFLSAEPQVLFNAARYLLALMAEYPDIPLNISKLDVLFALGRLTTSLDMFRLARQIHEKLQLFVIPTPVLEQIDIATLIMRGRPYQDREDLLPVCYRCGQTNPALSASGDKCAQCFHPFVRCFHSFEILPLVEFTVPDEISEAEAERMILGGAGGKRIKAPVTDEWQAEEANVMTFNDELVDAALDNGNSTGGDPFSKQQMQLDLGGKSKVYAPVLCQPDHLKLLKSDDVFIVKRPYSALAIPWRFYRNVVPSVGVTLHDCGHFYAQEHFEFESLKSGGCPFCRGKDTA
jgi:intraflagellar transport protein 122